MLIAVGALTSFRAAASPTPTMAYELYFFNNLASNFVIEQFNYSVTSSQPPGLFQPPYTYTASGQTVETIGLITYGGYWSTPTSTTALTITVNSGLTATVKNTSGVSQNLRMGIEFASTSQFIPPTLIYGSYVSIPAGGTMSLPIPSGSVTYQTTVPTLFSSEPYPAPVAFFISD